MAIFKKKLKEIMTENVVFSTPEASLLEIARMMVDCDCGEIPLVENIEKKNVIGVVTDRDIVCRTLGVGKDPMKLTARDCMTSPTVTCKQDDTVKDALQVMEEKKIRRIPIVDENDSLIGIIAQADLIEAADEDDAAEMIQEVSKPSESPSEVRH